MKLLPQKATYLGDITYKNEEDCLRHIERCGRLCYRSPQSKDIEDALIILNSWLSNGHTSLYEHSQLVLKIESSEYMTDFLKDIIKAGLYRFFDLDHIYDDIIAGNLRVWLHAYDLMGDDHSLIFGNIKGALPHFLSHWSCDARDDALVPASDVPKKLHRYAAFILLDRGVLAEWTRHDFGFSVESSRYCNYGKDKYGNSIDIHDQDTVGFFPKSGKSEDAEMARMIWIEANDRAENYYMKLLNFVKPEIARQVLNMSLMTRMHVSGIPWYWDNFFVLRKDAKAHPNIRVLAKDLNAQMHSDN